MAGVDYGAVLRRLKIIFKECRVMIPMDQFFDKLTGNDLITSAQEMQLRNKEYYTQIDDTFFILLTKNPKPTYEIISVILQDLKRDDILEKLYEDFGALGVSSQAATNAPGGGATNPTQIRDLTPKEASELLTRKWSTLVDGMEADDVALILVSTGFLPHEWEQGVPQIRKKKSEVILQVIRRRGPAGFQALQKALQEVNQLYLLE